MKDFSIKLGFVPTRRLVFDKNEAQKHKNLIRDKLLSWKINLVDIDWLNEDGTRGVKFINLCVESSQRGACWISTR